MTIPRIPKVDTAGNRYKGVCCVVERCIRKCRKESKERFLLLEIIGLARNVDGDLKLYIYKYERACVRRFPIPIDAIPFDLVAVSKSNTT